MHFACATGLSDCVIMLHGKGADLTKIDGKQRGCLQLARNCQGEGQTLATWLEQNVRGIYSSKISAGGGVGGGCREWAGAGGCGRVRVSMDVCLGMDVCRGT